jgi:DNA-binding transcriptional LysR family regulator
MKGLVLDQLRSFLDVVELGSFSAAAERAGLTQPAISLKLRQLERRLGLRLVERVGRRARPTAAGQDLADHARRIFDAVTGAEEAMARHASGTIGRVRLGTGATACIYLLPPILRELRRRFPSIDITVFTGNTVDVVRGVEENRLDLGLVTMPAGGRMIEVLPVREDPFVAIEPADEARFGPVVTAADLAGRAMLAYAPGANTRGLIDDWFSAQGQPLKPAMALGNVQAIKELVAAGLGAAILPRMAIAKAADRDRLAMRPLEPPLIRQLVVILRRDKPVSRAMREMIAALQAAE